jgi:hypothetical protein
MDSIELCKKLRSYNPTSGYAKYMVIAAQEIERLKERNTELNKKYKLFERLRIAELKEPATGCDYWRNYFKEKFEIELEEAKRGLTCPKCNGG